MSRRVLIVLWLLALLLWGSGLAGVWRTTARLRGATERLQRGRAQLGELEALAAQVAATRAAADALADAAAGPDDLKARVQAGIPGLAIDVRETAEAFAPGLLLRRATLEAESIPFGAVAELAAGLERTRPPWRVEKIGLRATIQAPGAGRAELVVTRVERVE